MVFIGVYDYIATHLMAYAVPAEHTLFVVIEYESQFHHLILQSCYAVGLLYA